jgi:hypothetical protein
LQHYQTHAGAAQACARSVLETQNKRLLLPFVLLTFDTVFVNLITALHQALTSSPREVTIFYHSDALMATPTDVDSLTQSASALDGDRPVPSSRSSLNRSSFSHSVEGAC